MKITRTKFILIFLVSAFVFQFVTNSLLGPELRLFPANGDWFPGTGSHLAWKNTLAMIVYPIKIVLIGPVSVLFNDPDPDAPPPIFLIAFACYWTILALVFHLIAGKIILRKKAIQ